MSRKKAQPQNQPKAEPAQKAEPAVPVQETVAEKENQQPDAPEEKPLEEKLNDFKGDISEHELTKEDLQDNPELKEADLKPGDVIDLGKPITEEQPAESKSFDQFLEQTQKGPEESEKPTVIPEEKKNAPLDSNNSINDILNSVSGKFREEEQKKEGQGLDSLKQYVEENQTAEESPEKTISDDLESYVPTTDAPATYEEARANTVNDWMEERKRRAEERKSK